MVKKNESSCDNIHQCTLVAGRDGVPEDESKGIQHNFKEPIWCSAGEREP